MSKDFKNELEIIKDKCKKYSLEKEYNNAISIQKQINEFKVKIVFIGGFSAGKSALINSMLDLDLLKEGQRPETAIANEIVYDELEYIEAITSENIEKFELTKIDDIDINKFDFLRWHINNKQLKLLNGYVLVDMPGFNSGIKAHNKAILQYINQANAYILVIDCEDGEIKQSMNEFINEIKNYQDNLAIVITKCDLKVEEDIESIKENICYTASEIFGKEIEVISTSKFDENISNKINNLIQKFNKKNILNQQFKGIIYNICNGCVNCLELIKKSSKLDISDFEEEIYKRDKARKELLEKLNKEKSKLERKFKNSVLPSIIADVNNALYQRTDTLVNSIKGGGNDFSMIINNILRPVLISSTEKYTNQSFDEFISEINFNNEFNNEEVNDLCNKILDKYNSENLKMKQAVKIFEKSDGMYKAITTALAVTTSIITPWLELVLIFLPDILNLFTFIGKGNQDSKIKEKINKEVIPQISQKLTPEIEKSLEEMKDEMILATEERISTMIESETEALEKAKQQMENAREEYEKNIKDIDKDILEINNIIKSL
ncbi:MAG: dynamin family protein [Candidatus Onthovivens sp.]|nr:dynamin family protein [Candidatus Onthovivens sp.]